MKLIENFYTFRKEVCREEYDSMRAIDIVHGCISVW